MDISNSTPPTDDSAECILNDLVGNDRFYEDVLVKLNDPNKKDGKGNSLLHRAAWSREENSRIVQLLLEKGADVHSTTLEGQTPLHFAVACRKRNIVVALIDAGASVNWKDFWERTALHFAIGTEWSFTSIPDDLNIACDMWIVDRLLCYSGIDINSVDWIGNTPLIRAIKEQNLDAVRRLLKKGANPNIPNRMYQTPLHKALYPRNPNRHIAYDLLKNGAGIYCEDIDGETPIDILVRNVLAHETVMFAKQVVWLIAFRYRITESLQRKLEEIPVLSKYLAKCCKEVTLMRRQIISGKFTLYDFALGCFQSRVLDKEREKPTPVLKLISSGSYVEYLNLILENI